MWATDHVQFASGWSGLSWYFVTQPHSGTLQVDDYREQAGGAVGQRSGMRNTDNSLITAWEYNAVGRVTKETQALSGQGSFVTQWGYFNAGLLSWMQYPGGETLTYGYHPQGALNSLTSSLGESLVYSTSYDAAGRLTQRKLGGATALQTANTYFDWTTPNGAGRLKQITAGTSGDPDGLLDLRYFSGTNTPTYDAFGNLLNIYNYTVGQPRRRPLPTTRSTG